MDLSTEIFRKRRFWFVRNYE